MAQRRAIRHRQIEDEARVIYVLDTDVLSIVELHDSPEYTRLHARVLELAPEDSLVTTIVTYEEQTRGWLAYAAKSRRTPHQVKAYLRLRQHLRIYTGIEVLDFDDSAGQEFDRLCGMKLRIGTTDLKIAAIVTSRNALLISRNLGDFKRIPGLRVEDWTR
jgi:tRNA(fMet)-specific endonuclease VapC